MFFLGDIALVLELFAFCVALAFLHHASKENSALLRVAGIILLVGSLALGVCTWMGVSKRRAFLEKAEVQQMTKQDKPHKVQD